MTKRLYSVDDDLNLDWVDIKDNHPIYEFGGILWFRVMNAKDCNTDFKFWGDWIYDEETKKGVWHETPQGVARQLKARARQIEKIPVHPF